MAPGWDLSGELIDDRYRVEYLLGRGGMGSVWSVQHVESLKRFALKTLTIDLATQPSARERLLREARAGASLPTRHVVQIVDARIGYLHQGEPLPYLVMERLEGFTLEHWLTTRGPLSAGEVLWVMRQVGRALQLAHERGIVHRDIKPSNVFLALDEEGEPLVKLCDFGIAKLTATAAAALLQSSAGRTTAGDFLGTPLYLAPELLRGAEHAIPATDQWAIGLMVFRALTGREYFTGATSGPELVLRIAQDPLPAPSSLEPSLPPAFDSWFFRACARDPKRRYDSVEQQVEALKGVLGPAEPRPVPIGPASALSAPMTRVEAESDTAGTARSEHRSRRERRSPLRSVALAGSVVWALGGTFWLLWATPPLGDRSSVAAQRKEENGEAHGRSLENRQPEAATGTGATLTTTASASDEGAAPPQTNVALATASAPPPPPPRSAEPALAASPSSPSPPPSTSERGASSTRSPRSSSAESSSLDTAASAPRSAKLASGQPCRRSAECESGLCLAEQCQ